MVKFQWGQIVKLICSPPYSWQDKPCDNDAQPTSELVRLGRFSKKIETYEGKTLDRRHESLKRKKPANQLGWERLVWDQKGTETYLLSLIPRALVRLSGVTRFFLTFGQQKIICDALAMEETRGCVDIFDKPPIYDNIIWLMLARNRRTKSTKRKYKLLSYWEF